MTPWMLLTALVAAINLSGFIALRGRWGRVVLPLAIASLLGTVIGDAVGARTGLELLRLGDFHIVAASVGAQLAMLVTLLLSALVPSAEVEPSLDRRPDPRRPEPRRSEPPRPSRRS
jgi:hypothetical protein